MFAIPTMLAVAEWVFDFRTRYPLGEIAWIIMRQIGIPLAFGMLLARFLGERRSAGVAPWLSRVGDGLLILGMLMILSFVLPDIWGMMENGRLWSVAGFTGIAIAGGHIFGGSKKGVRDNLVMASVQRHPGISFVVATTVLPTSEETIVAVIAMFLLFSTVATLPYLFDLRKKTAEETPPSC